MKLHGLRWWIVGLLFLASVLNYVDKNALALLAPTIQRDLGFDDQTYANIQNAFQIAYTVALLCSGLIVDRYGARVSLAVFVGWWSVANALTALARSAGSLGIFRLLLGLGEAGNWTAAPKTVAEWFPARERGLAIGIYTAGTPLGMTLAPLFIIGLASTWGWRAVFVVTGLLGLLWIVPWLLLNRPSKTHPWLAGQERALLHSTAPDIAASPCDEARWSWRQALGQPVVWCLLLGRMFSDPVWFFYQNWYPKYLVTARGLGQDDIKMTWIMFLAAGIGGLLGGWLADRFIKQGMAPVRARLLVMLGCAVLMPLSPLVAQVPTPMLSLLVASLIVCAHLAWLTNIGALVVDIVPKASLGAVFGIVAAGSSLGAIMMNDLVAKLVKYHSYTHWFWIAAGLHLAVIPLLGWGVLRHARKER